jgi:hypothetical protein
MGVWRPSTKEEVEEAVKSDLHYFDVLSWKDHAHMLVDPYKAKIFRFECMEEVCVVAKGPQRVVYFDDIEEDFGTAIEKDGQLVNCDAYISLVAALQEASRNFG